MDHVACPECGYRVGLGMASDPGFCPRCELPLMHTCEFRALSAEALRAEVDRQLRMEAERQRLPLT